MTTSRQLHISELNDVDLIAEYKKSSDGSCIAELFKRYSPLVYGVCLKYLKSPEDAKDASMNIFEKMFEDVKKHKIDYFKGWLHMVSKNHCLMLLRSVKGKAERSSREIEEKDAKVVDFNPTLHQEDSNAQEQSLQDLQECIQELKKEQKQCVKLFYLEKKCYQDVAEETNFELKKVKSYIQNGKRNLKICIEKKSESRPITY